MKLWLNNTIEDRLYMLQKAAKDHPGINQLAIEKDWWVMVTLKALFRTTCADSLIFKGGTSLSKGFQIIERFSEDIDLAISHSFSELTKRARASARNCVRWRVCSSMTRCQVNWTQGFG